MRGKATKAVCRSLPERLVAQLVDTKKKVATKVVTKSKWVKSTLLPTKPGPRCPPSRAWPRCQGAKGPSQAPKIPSSHRPRRRGCSNPAARVSSRPLGAWSFNK